MILHIPYRIWLQIREYVQAAQPNEVTGIGAIKVLNKQEVRVTEIFLPRQKADPAYSEFAKGELAKIVSNFVRNNPASAGNLCFRWHSHGIGKVYWSSIDNEDIDHWKGKYVFNLVTNVQGDVLARVDIFEPFRLAVDAEVVIDYPSLTHEERQNYFDEVCTKVVPIPPKPQEGEDLELTPDELDILDMLSKSDRGGV